MRRNALQGAVQASARSPRKARAAGGVRRKLTGWALLANAIILGAASNAGARPLAGDREFQVTGGFSYAQGASSGNINADASIGYFLPDPAWEIGFSQGLAYQFIDGDPDVWTASTVPFLNYHFLRGIETQAFVPFIGAIGGMIWNDKDVTGTLGPSVGFKMFLSEQAFFVTRYRYEWFIGDLRLGNSEKSNDGNHVVTMGLGLVWGAAERETPGMRNAAYLEQAERITKRAEEAAERAAEAAERAETAAEKARSVAPAPADAGSKSAGE